VESVGRTVLPRLSFTYGGAQLSAFVSEEVVASSGQIFNLRFGNAVLGAFGDLRPKVFSLLVSFELYFHRGR